MNSSDTPSKSSLWLTIAALGVVFGDIGTSPLYTFYTALQQPILKTADLPLGIASLIIWSLMAIVTLKYVMLVMRADYHGEGGIFALLALLKGKKILTRKIRLPFLILLILFGASLLYGDGAITPAISVLSALEGLEQVYPSLAHFIIPLTVLILFSLFSVQRFGTGRLGKIFGIIMLFWFIFLGASGGLQVLQMPSILKALNPYYAWKALLKSGPTFYFLIGAIVLAVTGVEALYADMGHFGRKTITRAWILVVLPCLILNYLGQAVLAMKHPLAWKQNLFFMLVPKGTATLILVALATVATIIASQALIAGVFSLSAQARELGCLPRFLVLHTNRFQRGQVYLPTINWLLAVVCLLLVTTFRSSNKLADAYGLAVIGTMFITSISFSVIVVKVWHYPRWIGLTILLLLSSIELPFLFSSLTKFSKGGWVPFIIATFLMTMMITWHRGKALLRHKMLSALSSIERLIRQVNTTTSTRIPGTLVIISSSVDPRYALGRALEFERRDGSIRKQVVLLSLLGSSQSFICTEERVKVVELAPSIWHIVASYGYMQNLNVPEVLNIAAPKLSFTLIPNETFFLLPHETIVEYQEKIIPRWQQKLFGWLSRNVTYAPDYFFIPYQQIIEFTWMLKV